MKITGESDPGVPAQSQHPIPADPIAEAVRSTFRDPKPVEPIDKLQAEIEKLLRNQRTPGTVELTRRRWVAFLILCIVVGLIGVLNLIGVLSHWHASSSPAPVVHTASVTAAVTDAQLAADLSAACDRHPGACRHAPTATNVASVYVPYVCSEIAQGTTMVGTAWRGAWAEIEPLVQSTGRCGHLTAGQLATAITWVPGGTGPALTASGLDQVLAYACPEIADGAHAPTDRARLALAVIAASGACSR